MSDTVLVVKHRTTGAIKKRVFKARRGEIRRLRRLLRDWELIDVEGDPDDPVCQFLRQDLEKYRKDPSSYLIDRKGIMKTASKVTGKKVEVIGTKASKFLKRLGRKQD